MKHITRTSAALAAGAIIALAVPTAAFADATATPTSTAAGSSTTVTFAIPHGCDASPTQVVTIDLPESIVSVTPTAHALWSIEKVAVPLDEPIESATGGDPITERIGQVVYTSTIGGLPSDQRDTFDLSFRLPAGESGDVLEFPVTQTCTEGSVTWDGEEVPTVVLTAATGDDDGHGGEAAEGGAHSDNETETVADSATDAAQVDVLARVLGVVGVFIGVVGIVIAIIARRAARAQA
jgi:uncharacterized protein YcnI